ncbi:hypothetical protein VTK26DRAFT_4865 [Humicola hyalothermophila]
MGPRSSRSIRPFGWRDLVKLQPNLGYRTESSTALERPWNFPHQRKSKNQRHDKMLLRCSLADTSPVPERGPCPLLTGQYEVADIAGPTESPRFTGADIPFTSPSTAPILPSRLVRIPPFGIPTCTSPASNVDDPPQRRQTIPLRAKTTGT